MKLIQKLTHPLGSIIKKKPFFTITLLFVFLMALIVASYFLRQAPQTDDEQNKEIKKVETFSLGKSPSIKTLARIDKENLIYIKAQTAGIIQKLYVKEGQHINYRGQNLLHISSNYQGADSATIRRQMSEKQYQQAQETYDLQKEMINQDRELTKKTDENTDELREIQADSIDETKDLIELNEEIIDYIDEQIAIAETAGDEDEVASQKQIKYSYLSSLNAAKANLRSLEYDSDDNEIPAQMANLTKDRTLKALDLQEKVLTLNLEISRLQYQIDKINESLSYPASFSNGNIEKIHVRPGQMVDPGDLLITMSGCNKAAFAVVETSKDITLNTSLYDSATLYIADQTLQLPPIHISKEAVNGTAYEIKYAIPEEYEALLTDQEYITVELPIGLPNTNHPFIPLDTIYQSNDGSYVFIINENGQVNAKKIELGEVFGQYVTVLAGLDENASIIMNRSVVEGESVKPL